MSAEPVRPDTTMIGTVVQPAQRLDDLHAVEPRHPEVQQHDVGVRLRGEGDRRGAVRRGDDLVAVRGEGDPQGAHELRVVVGDQDLHRRVACDAVASASGSRRRAAR